MIYYRLSKKDNNILFFSFTSEISLDLTKENGTHFLKENEKYNVKCILLKNYIFVYIQTSCNYYMYPDYPDNSLWSRFCKKCVNNLPKEFKCKKVQGSTVTLSKSMNKQGLRGVRISQGVLKLKLIFSLHYIG